MRNPHLWDDQRKLCRQVSTLATSRPISIILCFHPGCIVAAGTRKCTHVHILYRHYVMCPIFRSFWTLLRMIVCPTRFLATARFGSRCKMLDKARCDIRSRCCLVWILLALLFEGKFTRKRNTCRLNTIADSETELNERINMVTPTTTGTPARWMQHL